MQDAIDYILKSSKSIPPFVNEVIGVDLACGSAIFSAAYALNFSKPGKKAAIKWYPTDFNAGDTHAGGSMRVFDEETMPALRFLAKDTSPQFQDGLGQAVFIGDSVVLHGLSTDVYNNEHGILRGRDPKAEGRFGVRLVSKTFPGKIMSFKPQNMLRAHRHMGEIRPGMSMEEATKQSNSRKETLEGLCQRARILNIKDINSIKKSKDLYGKVMILTCSNLLRE
ncbi:MAG: hypothetical protein SGARI_007917, partial [Bacillariaceae sp.]